MVRLKIDGHEVLAHKEDTILSAARRANIYIPTLCHLPKVAPIASCRLCLVGESDTQGYILSCQTPAREGMNIYTQSEELRKFRRQIMELYALNHPLECGVCDKSGECELQNRVHEFGVSEQEFCAREIPRAREQWGEHILYDESLCIVCERCVRVCNEIVGDSCLRVQPGGYASRIVFNEAAHCSSCGECASVCPVGALTHRHFHYTSNAWELKKISSSCHHCALSCALDYEVKIAQKHQKSKIYRVTSDRHFGKLCKMGRYAFRNEGEEEGFMADLMSEARFSDALEAFKRADTIAFSSYITNEEALILQKLKESRGYKLYNPEAWAFGRFYHTVHQGRRDDTSVQSVQNSDCIVALGGRFYDEVPLLRSAMNEAQKTRGAKLFVLHPLEESRIKSNAMLRYEVGAEEGVVALLMASLVGEHEGRLGEFLSSFDVGYVSSESNLGEEELGELVRAILSSTSPILIIGADLYAHKRAINIARMLGILQKHSNLKILLTPPSTNTLGVSLICDLDEEKGNYTIGYNTQGDYILSSLPKKANLLMPALNQQEGTLLNIDKRVIPIHPALPYEGYELNDLAKAMGLSLENTIDYTPLLPEERGFLGIEFDSLPNHYENDGTQRRGYGLGIQNPPTTSQNPEESLEEVDEIDEYNGTILYTPSTSPEAQMILQGDKAVQLRGARPFALAAKITSGDLVRVSAPGFAWSGTFVEDPMLKGVIAILNISDIPYGYPYRRVKVERLESRA